MTTTTAATLHRSIRLCLLVVGVQLLFVANISSAFQLQLVQLIQLQQQQQQQQQLSPSSKRQAAPLKMVLRRSTRPTISTPSRLFAENDDDENFSQEESSSSSSSSSSALLSSPHRRRQFLEQTTKNLAILLSSAISSTLMLSTSPSSLLVANAAYLDPATNPPKITDRVYLDVEWVSTASVAAELTAAAGLSRATNSGKQQGRITIGLYGEAMPKTVENFVTLCKQNAYAGTSFYRIISDYSIQGGAIGDTSDSGKTGQSSLEGGASFEPDNFTIMHTQKGLLSMVKARNGGVDSRFFIQLKDDAGWADDRYAAFGIVLEGAADDGDGLRIVDSIEKVPVQPPKNNPKEPVKIVASGVL
jgi:peptidyl-prolyl cis-trans isomerase B (cyclophilin B)